MAGKKILIVEDDSALNSVLEYNLAEEGYEVLKALDGLQALDTARSSKPDLVILDVMLPKMSGFEVCRILRSETTVPILILTAKANEIDKIVGLDLGADDYVTKPFVMRELVARVRAILRRSDITAQKTSDISHIIKTKDLEIDILRHKAAWQGKLIELTPKEYDLLVFLIKNKELTFNREQLLEKVWGYDYLGDTRTVDVHIRWLRQKIERDPEIPEHLITLRGIGYKYEE